MTIEIPSGNTTLLASQVASFLVAPLQEQSQFLSAGGTLIDSAGPVRVPVSASTTPAAAFVGAGVQITDSKVPFTEVTLLPSDLKALKVLTRVSNELVRQSVVGLETVLQQRLITDTSLVLDAALFDGAGTANTIKGILRQTGITTGVLDLTNPDSIIDGLAAAQGFHVNPTHIVMTAAAFSQLRKLKVGAGDARYLLDPNLHEGTSFTLFGLPVIVTDNIPNVGGKARVAIVDFNRVIVARDVDSEVKFLDQTWGDYDSIGIRVVTRFDVALSTPRAVTLLTQA